MQIASRPSIRFLVSMGLAVTAALSSMTSFSSFALLAKEPLNETVKGALSRLQTDIEYLASDERKGRAAETTGLREAADYLAERFTNLGLKTDLFEGTPFQNFSLDGPLQTPPEKNRLQAAWKGESPTSLELGTDYQPQTLGKNGSFDAEVVFVGYGITSTDGVLYDDYAGIDVTGKVVVVLRKEPQADDPKSPFDGTEPSQHALFTTKEINAAKHGAAALILVNDAKSDQDAPDTLFPIGTGGGLIKDQIPTLFMKRSLLAKWISQAGKSLEDVEKGIDSDLKPRSFLIPGLRIAGEVAIEKAKVPSFNVLGLLPGQGDLAGEYVVIGAHFDHVGMGGPGSLAPGTIAVHNGADDNASGTVALLETALRMKDVYDRSGDKPRRNILFIAFSGEERGLLGSIYYCNHPRFELERTVAMLNMDMVGRLQNDELTIYGTGTATEFDSMITKANESLAFRLERLPEGMGPSDHQSFFMKNIPVLHFFTGLHDDYHRPSDDFDKINLIGIDRITDMVSQLAEEIAFNPAKPSFVKVRGRANPQANRQRALRLGVRLNDTVVERILPGSLAEKASIREGDRLIKIGDTSIGERADIDRALPTLARGKEAVIEVERNGEKVQLKVTVPE
ncbi:MAG: M28 family peptidase [Pirellula sp.]|nr:M28 family peptidase [Pirellula sp.]